MSAGQRFAFAYLRLLARLAAAAPRVAPLAGNDADEQVVAWKLQKIGAEVCGGRESERVVEHRAGHRNGLTVCSDLNAHVERVLLSVAIHTYEYVTQNSRKLSVASSHSVYIQTSTQLLYF